MGRDNRKETEVLVNVVDITKYVEGRTHNEYDKLKVSYNYGWVETRKGIFLLNDEGVGDDKPIEKAIFEIHGEKNLEGGGRGTSICPILNLSMDTKELKELPFTQVNLKEFVRKFGSRLDSNYEEWRKTLDGN